MYALVTGGSRGIGRSIALRLAKEGYHVIINYQSNHQAAQQTLADITANGGVGELLPFDVGDKASVESALESWYEKHPDDYIAVLVNTCSIAL